MSNLGNGFTCLSFAAALMQMCRHLIFVYFVFSLCRESTVFAGNVHQSERTWLVGMRELNKYKYTYSLTHSEHFIQIYVWWV